MHAPVVDLLAMYAADDAREAREAQHADPWSDLGAVLRWSPLAHMANYETPTLVIHGERDLWAPLTQGLELYGVLKAKAVDARLVVFPDEHQWVLSPANSAQWYEHIDDWLQRHLDAGPSSSGEGMA